MTNHDSQLARDSVPTKEGAASGEGPSPQGDERKRGPLPPSCFLGGLVAAVALHFALPLAPVLAFPWRWVGVMPVAVGLALNLLADGAFKRVQTTVQPFEESSQLVTGGVFRVSRNPMYLGMVLVVAGVALLLGTAGPWLAAAGLAVALDRAFIGPEERMLAATFGQEWESYRRRVRRWI